jgi:hypothetical protein
MKQPKIEHRFWLYCENIFARIDIIAIIALAAPICYNFYIFGIFWLLQGQNRPLPHSRRAGQKGAGKPDRIQGSCQNALCRVGCRKAPAPAQSANSAKY